MFLFTNAPVGTRDTGTSAGGSVRAGGDVVDAIRDGAQASGVGFDYLLATAQRESSLDPDAKAGTSSATGLFQFIEQTWLGCVKSAGAKLGLSNYADAITARSDGSYNVADPATKQAILDLRRDPRVSAAMAGELARKNGEKLSIALGREPTSGDLYTAHVLGAKGAATLIASAQATPARAAALDLPDAAAANRNLFYDKSGRARGSAELYAILATSTAGGKAALPPSSNLPENASAYANVENGLRSLFQTDSRQGAVAPSVAKLWQGRSNPTPPVRNAPSYYPRDAYAVMDEEAAAASGPATTGSIETAAAIRVPLPPRRPAGLTEARPADGNYPFLASPRVYRTGP